MGPGRRHRVVVAGILATPSAAGGQGSGILERRAKYFDALGARHIPGPTTAGDFCRRSQDADVLALMEAINPARLRVHATQPAEFFGEPIVDLGGTLVATDAECRGAGQT
jgi:hypothetical protein